MYTITKERAKELKEEADRQDFKSFIYSIKHPFKNMYELESFIGMPYYVKRFGFDYIYEQFSHIGWYVSIWPIRICVYF